MGKAEDRRYVRRVVVGGNPVRPPDVVARHLKPDKGAKVISRRQKSMIDRTLIDADHLLPHDARGTTSATRSSGLGLEDSRPANRTQARREVVQVLLALAIVSTVAGVISALAAVWALLLQGRTKPQAGVVIADDIKTSAVERQPVRKPKRARHAAPRRCWPWRVGVGRHEANPKADTGPAGT